MLDLMRKKAGSWFIKIMLFGIIVVFSFWGVGSYSARDASTILTIDSIRVPYTEYQDIYNIIVETYRQAYPNLDSEVLKALDVKGQAIKSLVDRYLILESAKNTGIRTTVEEISADIAGTEAFQVNGFFSPQRYQTFLDLNRMSPEQYEQSLAKELTIQKMSDILKLTAVVTPQEVAENLDIMTTITSIKVLRLDPNSFIRNVGYLAEDDVADHFDENMELYRVPEMFTINVAYIDPLDLIEQVEVTDEEIEDWYEENEIDFTQPAAFSLRHILFALPAEASAESISEIRIESEEVARKIREGELSFTAAVSRWSDDKTTIEKGGELGLLEADSLNRTLLKAAEELGEGEASEPIPTSEGFEIIEVMERKPESLIPLEEVRVRIRAGISAEKAEEMAIDLADDIIDEVERSGNTLSEAASSRKLVLVTKGPYSRRSFDQYFQDLPNQIAFASMNTEEGEIGDILENEGKLYLFQTTARDESRLPDLEDVYVEVEGSLLVKKSLEKAFEKGKELLARLENGADMKTLAKELGQSIRTPEPFTIMDEALEGLEDGGTLVNDSFTLKKPGDAYLSEGTQAHYLITLVSRTKAEQEELDASWDLVRDTVQTKREQEVIEEHLASLRAEYGDRIVINGDLL